MLTVSLELRCDDLEKMATLNLYTLYPLRSLRVLLILVACALLTDFANSQTSATTAQLQTQSSSSSSQGASSASSRDTTTSGWQLDLSPYLWFAGAHGTVGAFGRDASVHASVGDLLSHFDIGLMGAAQARHNRFLLDGDLIWIRLSDSSALPFPGFGATSADVRVGQLVWTSKIGYRLLEKKGLKADANIGARYWHLGQEFNFNPSILGLSATASQSWTDVVVGGRLEFPLGPKASITTLGDVGGWNATAKLDYQFAGLLNFNVHPKWTISAGYRYLFVDYRNGGGIYNMVTDGAIIGVTYHIK